jgi:accessory colonization factor AcfC
MTTRIESSTTDIDAANEGVPSKDTDINEYSVYKIGSNELGDAVAEKLGKEPISEWPEEADSKTLVLFADSSQIKDDAVSRGKLAKLVNVDRAPVVMMSDDPKSIKQFADALRIKGVSENTVMVAYWVYPAGAMCETDHGVFDQCGGVASPYTIDANIDPEWAEKNPEQAAAVKADLPNKIKADLFKWMATVQ